MFAHSHINGIITAENQNLQMTVRKLFDAFDKLRSTNRYNFSEAYNQHTLTFTSYKNQAEGYLTNVLRAPESSIVQIAYRDFASALNFPADNEEYLYRLEKCFHTLVSTTARATIDVLKEQSTKDILALSEKLERLELKQRESERPQNSSTTSPRLY